MHRNAFTLIELLVVITIIVVLLALLVPALEKAVYQAQLATCGARLKGLGSGVTVYAMEYRRSYPHRPWVFAGSSRPNKLWNRVGGVFDKDERPLIRPYVGRMNQQVQCPLNKEMNLDQQGSSGAATESNVAYGSYYLLYGWGYKITNTKFEKAMRKIGDRFEYTEVGDGSVPPVVSSFDLLASDYDMYDQNAITVGSHPDQGPGAIMYPYELEDQSVTASTGVETPGSILTISRWTTGQRGQRAPIDMNFAHADGAVLRLNEVLFESKPGVPDERMARIPEASNKDPTFFTHLPPASSR